MEQGLIGVANGGVPALRGPLTAAQFGDLDEIPPGLEWLPNLTNPKTRRAYKMDYDEELKHFDSAVMHDSSRPGCACEPAREESRELHHGRDGGRN